MQVREQDKSLAHRVRRGVHEEREEERRMLESQLRTVLASAGQQELRDLEARYLAQVGEVGRGHRAAQSDIQVCADKPPLSLNNKVPKHCPS